MSLYDVRIELGLSPEELAAETGVHPNTIRNLEAGSRPRTSTAHNLTRFFSRELDRVVPATELFGAPERHLSVVPTDPEEAA